MQTENIAGAIEAILFCAGDPVPAKQLCEALDTDEKALKQMITYIEDKLEARDSGLTIVTLGDCYQMCSRKAYADFVKEALHNRRKMTLSPAALEVLSVVAYHQPVTRGYIEQVRGVDCGAVITTLCEKELICEAGKLDSPGRPNLYATTAHFLRCFGVSDLSQLPSLPKTKEEEDSEEEPMLT